MYPNYNQFSPQYFQQQFDNAMNQYKNVYNQQMNTTTNGNSGFVGQYVNSYDEVEKAQVPMNGMPTMFVGDGIFWIKKFVNGQPYISAYKFESINNGFSIWSFKVSCSASESLFTMYKSSFSNAGYFSVYFSYSLFLT